MTHQKLSTAKSLFKLVTSDAKYSWEEEEEEERQSVKKKKTG